jgi:outer membrane protein, heavy metal efflux system
VCNAVTGAASAAYVNVKNRSYRSTGRALLAAVALSGCVALSACVAQGTAGDQGVVRQLVRERAPLQLGKLGLSAAQLDADARSLLARPLTLDSAVRIALLNNRELRAQLLGLGVARGQLVQASVLPNLRFEAQLGISTVDPDDRHWELGAGFDLSQLLLRGARRGVAEAELSSARIEAAGATLDLAYQVRLAFYDVLAATQELELLRTTQRAFAAAAEAAGALHDAGNITDLELASERAAEQSAQVELEQAEADAFDARERLNVLLGLFGHDTAWKIEGPLPDPEPDLGDLKRLETRAITASLELLGTRARLEAAARRVGLTETAGWLPQLELGAHAEQEEQGWSVGPALHGSLPLFDRQQGNVISQQAELAALRERYTAAAIGIRAATRSARTRAEASERRVRRYREAVLPLREQVLRQTLLEYNAMQIGVFQLLQARREQLEASRGYVRTLREYWHARATLEQLLAGRLAGTLATDRAARQSSSRSAGAAAGAERGH